MLFLQPNDSEADPSHQTKKITVDPWTNFDKKAQIENLFCRDSRRYQDTHLGKFLDRLDKDCRASTV